LTDKRKMRVSVIVPVYNAAPYVREAVESALAQPETGEVILVEDGSPDNSLEVCRGLAQEFARVRLLQHKDGKNRGAGASRNLAIRSARHDYVAFLDADDFFLPGRFRVARELLESEPDVDGVYEAVGTYFQNDEARERWRAQGNAMLTTMRERVPPSRLFEALATGDRGLFCTDGVVVRKRIFDRAGCFNERLQLSQDSAMWLKMAGVGKLVPGQLDEPVGVRRVHGANRIFSPPEVIRHYRYLFSRFVFEWAYRRGLAARGPAQLLVRYHERWCARVRPSGKGTLAGKVTQLALLARIVLGHPLLLACSYFWLYCLELLELQWAGRLLGVGRPNSPEGAST